MAASVLSVLIAACTDARRDDDPAPFVSTAGDAALEAEAPFRGPARRLGPAQAEPLPAPPPDAPADPGLAIAPPPPPAVAEIAAPAGPAIGPSGTEAERRRQIWLTERFRCKAISTTRLRRCRFEQTADGVELRFPVADITCEGVVFDANGDPQTLTGCRGAWLRVPATNQLRHDRKRHVWSGSHSGWRWKGDRQTYCCPGMWLEAPAAIR